MNKEEKAKVIVQKLKKLFPKTQTALSYTTPWQLLVSVILSAQTTDKKVNEVTPGLFKKYKTVSDFAMADLLELEKDISTIGLFRMKAKNIKEAANEIIKKHNGSVPEKMEELVALPGVGRKTANVVMSEAFGKAEGIAVDTHVRRLSQVWGLTDNSDPDKIEKDLMSIVPKNEWQEFTFRVIDYGRKYCPARHKHTDCPLREYVIT